MLGMKIRKILKEFSGTIVLPASGTHKSKFESQYWWTKLHHSKHMESIYKVLIEMHNFKKASQTTRFKKKTASLIYGQILILFQLKLCSFQITLNFKLNFLSWLPLVIKRLQSFREWIFNCLSSFNDNAAANEGRVI